MNRLFSYISVVLLFFSAAGCSLDEPSDAMLPGDTVEMRFSVAVDGMKTIETRSVDPDGEEISVLWLFLFDENRQYVGHVHCQPVGKRHPLYGDIRAVCHAPAHRGAYRRPAGYGRPHLRRTRLIHNTYQNPRFRLETGGFCQAQIIPLPFPGWGQSQSIRTAPAQTSWPAGSAE